MFRVLVLWQSMPQICLIAFSTAQVAHRWAVQIDHAVSRAPVAFNSSSI
jgi:hypothetical protein